MDLHAFIKEYTDAVYHARDAEAASRYIADPCIRHEHGHRVVMSLEENKRRIGGFLAEATDVRFDYAISAAEGDLYATAYEFSFVVDGRRHERSGIEIFRVREGKIVETWNSAAGEGLWG